MESVSTLQERLLVDAKQYFSKGTYCWRVSLTGINEQSITMLKKRINPEELLLIETEVEGARAIYFNAEQLLTLSREKVTDTFVNTLLSFLPHCDPQSPKDSLDAFAFKKRELIALLQGNKELMSFAFETHENPTTPQIEELRSTAMRASWVASNPVPLGKGGKRVILLEYGGTDLDLCRRLGTAVLMIRNPEKVESSTLKAIETCLNTIRDLQKIPNAPPGGNQEVWEIFIHKVEAGYRALSRDPSWITDLTKDYLTPFYGRVQIELALRMLLEKLRDGGSLFPKNSFELLIDAIHQYAEALKPTINKLQEKASSSYLNLYAFKQEIDSFNIKRKPAVQYKERIELEIQGITQLLNHGFYLDPFIKTKRTVSVRGLVSQATIEKWTAVESDDIRHLNHYRTILGEALEMLKTTMSEYREALRKHNYELGEMGWFGKNKAFENLPKWDDPITPQKG